MIKVYRGDDDDDYTKNRLFFRVNMFHNVLAIATQRSLNENNTVHFQPILVHQFRI